MMHHHKNTRVQGAMPCGNPRRYESRDVVRMPESRLQGRKRKADQATDDDMETESEKHIHSLLKQQIKTDITLADHFSHHRTFTPATSHAPDVEKLVGVHGYKQYKLVNDLDAKIDFLRHCGLDDEEITLKLKEEMKGEVSSESGYGADPSSTQEKLQEIERKIQEKEKSLQAPDSFKGALELTRQAMDLEKSMAQRQGKEPVSYLLTTQKKFEVTHPDDPVNHIPEILSSIDGKKERASRRERRRRRKQERRLQYYAAFATGAEENCKDSDDDRNDNSNDSDSDLEGRDPLDVRSCAVDLCDEKATGNETHSASVNSQEEQNISRSSDIVQDSASQVTENSSCKKKLKSGHHELNTVEKTMKEMNGPIQLLSREEIKNNRLSIEEIRALPNFQNYMEGPPNKTVFVKNLPKKTTEEELASLFGSFQSREKSEIRFRLLAGRMKGQAFVTFPDEATAAEAIKLVNGYKLQDKPIILCFGKKH